MASFTIFINFYKIKTTYNEQEGLNIHQRQFRTSTYLNALSGLNLNESCFAAFL
jgi:hypothetical protein